MTDPTDGAAKFAQLSKDLMWVGEQLATADPDFPPEDVGRAFTTVAIALMLAGSGTEYVACYLRHLADQLDAG